MNSEPQHPNVTAPVEAEAAAGPSRATTGGRELTAGVALLSAVVAMVGLMTGGLVAVASLTGRVFGAWTSPEALSPGLIGAAMVGVAPGLFAVGRARVWEEVRTLVVPLVIVLVGLFAVSLINGGELQAAQGGSLFLVLFSLGWVAVLGVLAVAAVGCVLLQYRRPRTPLGAPVSPPPGWTKPFLAVVGSGWLGLGTGLLLSPDFWAALVPWEVDRADAQGLGVWALSLGVGTLGALAEDDLARVRPALIAVPGIALAATVVFAVHASTVDWASGPGISLIALVGGLLATGVVGRRLGARREGAGT
ncbi:hypothetical protein ACIGBL_00990 [Streptomyces sp. NPDC085614]|uniref:hypothetical protein n=1 Tax=Streptomyces sp. NPDC085614 TaxID=3365733 RepID=UPI0037CE41BE